MKLWHITEESFDPKKMHSLETIYAIGNGYFATRGTFEENYFGAHPATLLYGVFDDIAIGKEELANAPDWLPIKLFINGERFHMTRGKILAYHRTLDMQHGVLSRTVRWESPSGIRLKIQSERFACLALEDRRGNTSEGIHEACCGAVWQATVLGFAGLHVTDAGYTTHPCWPDGWTRLAFTFLHKGKPVFIDLRKE